MKDNRVVPAPLVKILRYFIYILPLALCFSYYPLIKLGENETMYFELSLPLIWLVIFDFVAFIAICIKYRSELLHKIFGSIIWWLFPLFITISIFWSLNPLRGILTAGVAWLLFFAVLSFYELKDLLDDHFWHIFWRWFFGASLFVCAWCIIQCILDVNNIPQSISLLCDGCVYQMFGFPRPNGWAIEPQFMGNLLLAPIIILAAKNCSVWPLLFLLLSTLFITLSRGAIYACIVGLLFLAGFYTIKNKKASFKPLLKLFATFVISFIFALNLQGIFAASSSTSDTYWDGVSKAINHLSLGVIDLKGGEVQPVENSNQPVENSQDPPSLETSEAQESSVFNGYVAESTDTRLRLSNSALSIWRQDFKTALFGVGLGGAGQALYDHGLSPAPREIVQNEYASILLETGLIGFLLFVALLVLTIKVSLSSKNPALLLSLLVAYGVSLFFFSGLTNALQIVLLPGLFICLLLRPQQLRQKS